MKEDKKNRVFLKILKCFVVLLLTVLAFVAVLATCSAKWALKTWNHLTADELVFHLRAPLDGTNHAMIDEFIKNCAVPAVVIAIVAAVLLVITGILKKKRLFWSISGIVLAASTGTTAFSAVNFWNSIDFGSYLDEQGQYSELIDGFYVDPSKVDIKFPDKKRNLVYIYIESM